MISTIKINKTEMYEAAKEGFTNATDLADYLVKKGVPFRSAHEITGKIVLYCIDNSKSLNELKIDEYKTFSGLIENDIYDKITVENCVLNRKLPGGPSKSTVLGAIKEGRKFLSKLNTFILQD